MPARSIIFLALAALAAATLRGGDEAGGRVLGARNNAEAMVGTVTCDAAEKAARGLKGEGEACTPGPNVDLCCQPEQAGYAMYVHLLCAHASSPRVTLSVFHARSLAAPPPPPHTSTHLPSSRVCHTTKHVCVAHQHQDATGASLRDAISEKWNKNEESIANYFSTNMAGVAQAAKGACAATFAHCGRSSADGKSTCCHTDDVCSVQASVAMHSVKKNGLNSPMTFFHSCINKLKLRELENEEEEPDRLA